MSGSNENLRVGIDASGAKAGADVYKRELSGIIQAVEAFDKKTDLVFKSLKTRMQSVDFRSISQAASQINNIHINPNLATGITHLGTALRNFRAPSSSVSSDLSLFSTALRNLHTPTVDVAKIAALTASLSHFRAPSQQQAQNLKDFVNALNTMHVNNQNIAQVEAGLHRIAAAANAASASMRGLNAQTGALRVPGFGGGGGGRRGGGGGGAYGPRPASGTGGPYDGIFSGSQRAVGEMRGLENVANPSFQAASVLRTMIPAITTGEMFKSLYDEGAKLTQFQHVLEVATTVKDDSIQSQNNLNDMMQAGSDIALKYGLNLDTTREGFSHFVVNMKLSNHTLGESKQGFEDLSSVMRALGTDSTRQEQVMRGLNTALANGYVSSIQLTRQFDTALPGFKEVLAAVVFLEKHKIAPTDSSGAITQLTAAQQKVAGTELAGAITKKQITPDALLMAAHRMAEITKPGLTVAMEGLTAQTERFGTQWKLMEDKMLGRVGEGGLQDKMAEQIKRMTDLLQRTDVQQFFMNMAKGIAEALRMMGDAAVWAADHMSELILVFKAFLAIGMLNAVTSIGGAFGRMAGQAGAAGRALLGLIPVMTTLNDTSLLAGSGIDRIFTRLAGLPGVIALAIGALATYSAYQERNEKSGFIPGATNKEAWGAAVEVGKEDALNAASQSAADLMKNINDVAHAFGMATEKSVSWGDITLAAIVGVSVILKSIAQFPHNFEFVVTVIGELLLEKLKGQWDALVTMGKDISFMVHVLGLELLDAIRNTWNEIRSMSPHMTFYVDTVFSKIGDVAGTVGDTVGRWGNNVAGALGYGGNSGPVVNPEGGPTGSGSTYGPSDYARRLQQKAQHDRIWNPSYNVGEAPSVGTTIPDHTAASPVRSALQEGSGKTKKGPKDHTEGQLDTLEKSLGDGMGMIRKFIDQKKILDEALAKGDFKNSVWVTEFGMTQAQAYQKDLDGLKNKLLETMGALTAYGKAVAEVDKAQGMANAGVKLGILTQEDATKMMARVNEEHSKVLHPVESNIEALQKENQLLLLGTKERSVQTEIEKIKDANKKAGGPDITDAQTKALEAQLRLHEKLQQYAANQNVGMQAWANSFQDLYTELGKVEQKLTGSLADALTKFATTPRKNSSQLKPGEVRPLDQNQNPFAGLLQSAKTDIMGAMIKDNMKSVINSITGGGDPKGSVLLGGIESMTGIPLRQMMGGAAPGGNGIGKDTTIGSIMANLVEGNAMRVTVVGSKGNVGNEGGSGVFSNAKTSGGGANGGQYWDGRNWLPISPGGNGSESGSNTPAGTSSGGGGTSAGSLGGNMSAMMSLAQGKNPGASGISGLLGSALKMMGPATGAKATGSTADGLFSGLGNGTSSLNSLSVDMNSALAPADSAATQLAMSAGQYGPMAETAAQSAFDSAGGGLSGAISSGASSLWGSMSNGFQSFMSMFAEGGYSDSPVNRARMPSHMWAGTNVKHYADGTSNTRDTIPAMLSNDEAVIPLSRGRSIPVEMRSGNGSSGGGSGSNPINIHFHNVTDMNGFKNSEAQIHTSIGSSVSRAMARNS